MLQNSLGLPTLSGMRRGIEHDKRTVKVNAFKVAPEWCAQVEAVQNDRGGTQAENIIFLAELGLRLYPAIKKSQDAAIESVIQQITERERSTHDKTPGKPEKPLSP